jgi:hypothetical protein
VQNDGVAAAITDDRAVASVQNELLSLVFLNEVFDRLANPFGAAPWLSCLHSILLFWVVIDYVSGNLSFSEEAENWGVAVLLVGAGDYLRGRSSRN